MCRYLLKNLLSISGLCLLFLLPQAAEAKSWQFGDWSTEIRINQDGSFNVRETRTYVFDGIFSWAENEFLKSRVTDITDFKVYDEQNNLLSYPEVEINDTDDSIIARLNFSAANEQRIWIFEYKVLGGIGFFEDHDELYWNILPLDREVSVENVSVTLVLPLSVNNLADFEQTIYIGEYNSSAESSDYKIIDGRTIIFWGKNFAPYEGMTIVSSWPKKIVNDPGTLRIEAVVGDKVTAGVKIIIDGEDINNLTPWAYQLRNPAKNQETYIFSLRKFGYQTEPKELSIVRGETHVYSFTLIETWWYRLGRQVLAVLSILMWLTPFLAFYYYYRRWERLGKDPKSKGTIIPQYEPPKNMRPSEIGTLIDEKAQLRDITPIIIDLAVRGYLTIVELKKSRLARTANYKLIRSDKSNSELARFENRMMSSLFGGKKEVKLSDLKKSFYRQVPEIKKLVYESVTNAGYFEESPADVRKRYLLVPMVLFFLSGIATIALLSFTLSSSIASLTAPLVLVSIVGMIFSVLMPRKTNLGSEAKWWTEGFKLYLSKAEKFRLGAMTPETFEKYLPYAMVLGVEKKWENRFKDIYKEPPDWYVPAAGYHGAFTIAQFSKNLSSFTTSSAGSMSPPGSSGSSSSGFSGGFSGGGGGGGGASAG